METTLERDEGKKNNKKALLFMIYAFSLLKLRVETVQNLLKSKGQD